MPDLDNAERNMDQLIPAERWEQIKEDIAILVAFAGTDDLSLEDYQLLREVIARMKLLFPDL